MSLLRQSEADVAYRSYYSAVPESELAEDTTWASFATKQLAALCCDEDSLDWPHIGSD
jgi:hypothetical protein